VTRILIVNADDLGHSREVNRGIARAHAEGIVTSASLMVRRDAAKEAAGVAVGLNRLSLGLHVDLGEWTYGEGGWVPGIDLVPEDEIEREIGRQVGEFRSLVGSYPTHLDSHQHVHRDEPARSIMVGIADDLGVPLRHVTRDISYLGLFYGQSGQGYPVPEAIAVEALLGIVRGLPEGVTELGCHPAEPGAPDPVYSGERALELETLCDPRVRRAIEDEGIQLRSFAEVTPL
jgi:predicted glycoside hydrolase/deacetylase ChbG (UPF0249 family)